MLGKKPPKKRKIKKQYDGYLFSFPIVFLLGALRNLNFTSQFF